MSQQKMEEKKMAVISQPTEKRKKNVWIWYFVVWYLITVLHRSI